MNKYESVIIVNNSIEENQKEETINKIKKFIEENGEITKTDILGPKRLAYEIRKQNMGYYVVFNFNAEPT